MLVNGFAVALHPSQKTTGLDVLKNNVAIRTARHALYDALLAGGSLQAIVAFGDVAHTAYDLWAAANPAVTHVPVLKLAHPAAVDRTGSGNDAALKGWHQAVATLRGIVTADPDGDPTVPNFGAYFTEVDYARIPRWDFPRVTPAYVGDDSWGRSATPRHNNCCDRPSPDDGVSLVLTPPAGQGAVLALSVQGWRARWCHRPEREDDRRQRRRHSAVGHAVESGGKDGRPSTRSCRRRPHMENARSWFPLTGASPAPVGRHESSERGGAYRSLDGYRRSRWPDGS